MKEVNTFFFWFYEDDDNLRYHSLIKGSAVAVISIRYTKSEGQFSSSFGDFLGFNPHLHILCSDGCFYGEGMFRVAPRFETKNLEEIFRHKVFKMLLSKGKITGDTVNMLMS